MPFHSESPLDATDWRILRELQKDARLSFNELGRRVALSAPAAAERVRKLEDRGVITGYSAQIDPAQVGLPMLVFVQLRCDPEKCLLRTSNADAFPEVLEFHKLSGSVCSLLKVAVSSMQHLEALLERLSQHGNVTVNISMGSALTNRVIDWENPGVNVIPSAPATWTNT